MSELPDPRNARAESAPPIAMLGRYQLCCELASGGMATVYLARQEGPNGFEKLVALKHIHPHLAKDPIFLELFLDEARIAARINHPNVCAVYDYGEVDGIYYLALEYLEGETLRSIQTVLEEDPRHATGEFAAHIAYIVAHACEGLHAAHELKNDDDEPLRIVHRDVSPHNLFVNYDGSVRVVDFGIARAEDQVHQTDTGTIRGKYAYMAPEQIRGDTVDRRADIWALGVCLWELMAGRSLFDHPTDASTIFAVSSDEIEPPSTVAKWIPPELDAIVMKALERDRERRYATARELARDLHRFSATRGTALMAADVAEWLQALMPEQIAQKRKLIQRAKALGNEARRASGMSGTFGVARGAMFATPPGGMRSLSGQSLAMLASVSRSMPASDSRSMRATGDAPTAAASMTPTPVTSLAEAPTQAQVPVPRIPPMSVALAVPVPVAVPATQPAAPAAVHPPRSKRRLGLAIGVAIGVGAAAGAVMFALKDRSAKPATGEPIAAAPAQPGANPPAPAAPPAAPGPTVPPAPTVPSGPTVPAASPPVETAPSEPSETAAGTAPETAPSSRESATSRRRRQRAERARLEAGRGSTEDPAGTAATTTSPAPVEPAPPTPTAPVVTPPAPPVETPKPTPLPTPAPVPTPPPAPRPRPTSFEADASIGSLTIDGPLAQSVVRRAIDRVVPAFRDCYRTAAMQASANPGASVKIRMTLDESGRARSARVDPSTLPKLSECLRAATLTIRSSTAPDTGNLEATFVVKFAARP